VLMIVVPPSAFFEVQGGTGLLGQVAAAALPMNPIPAKPSTATASAFILNDFMYFSQSIG
jgi:hypothetical protein